MNLEEIWGKFFPFSIWTILKGGLLFALGLYVLFALVVLRQVYMMAEVMVSKFNWLIKIFAWLHLVLSVVVFLFAFVFL